MTNESLVIYSMNKVGRIVPSNKQILRDREASLGFYYGAKTPALHHTCPGGRCQGTQCGASVGVLGLNGAGKSTLLRIMAGVDKDYIGEIPRAPSKGC